MFRLPFTFLAFLCFALNLLAQDNSSTVHEHSKLTVDGTTNPDLIPDSTAYRLFFIVAGTSPDATPKEQMSQQAHVAKIGLNQQQTESLVSILGRFKIRYTALLKRYNDAAEIAASKGEAPEYSGFLSERDGLVQATRDRLKEVLTPEAMAILHAHVQREKRGMRLFGPSN